jgi:ubiquinone/menaquinone biosynthesis C-methylase UbiE
VTSRWRSYRDVDAAIDPGLLSDELDDIASVPFVEAERVRSLGLLDLALGDSVLDVGCGNGRELERLRQIVGPHGRVVGLDPSTALLGNAEARGPADHGSTELVLGDAHSMPFEDARFHACRADRTLQHLVEPDVALREMVRVTCSGGRVVVTELRWGLVAPTLNREVTDRVLEFVATDSERTNWVGHGLPLRFEQAGLTEVREVTTHGTVCEHDDLFRFTHVHWSAQAAVRSGVLTSEQADTWRDCLSALVIRGEALAVGVILHVTGIKR